MAWQPTIIRRADRSLGTAAETVRVTTDAGPGYLKALGNRGGPHRLAADWVGTHTHCFDGPGYLNAKLSHIDLIKDDQLYGLFPEFKPLIRSHWPTLQAAIAKLQTLRAKWVTDLVAAIPVEWQVDQTGRAALANLVYNRADYVAGTFVALIQPAIA